MSDVVPGDAGSFFDDSNAYDVRGGRVYEQAGSNLTQHRWHDAILSPGEERGLIRATQGGDMRAKDRLIKCFHRLILKIAKQYSGPSRDDLIAAGAVGFLEAIHRFDLRRNNALAAYAESWIRNRIGAVVKDWRLAGDASDTRADRLVYSTDGLTAPDVATKAGCSLADAEAAIARAEAHRGGHDQYDATESNHDDDDNFLVPKPAAAHDMYGFAEHTRSRVHRLVYDCFSPYQLASRLRFHGWPLGLWDGYDYSRCDGVSRQIDELSVASDKKAARSFKAIGRRRYAQWLVDRERRIAEDRKALMDTDHRVYGQLWRDPVQAKDSKLQLEQAEAARRKQRREAAKLKLIRCEKLDEKIDARMQIDVRHKQVA